MRLFAVKTPVVRSGDDLVGVVLGSLRSQGLDLMDDDVVALASKVVSYSEGRIVRLGDVKPSSEAVDMAKKYSLKPEFAEVVLREADRICGGVEKAVLALKNGVLAANAGVDNKNTPGDSVVLWPASPEKSAARMRERFEQATGKRVGVVIVDSGLVPLRVGTTGLALGVAGFKPVRDVRGRMDLFGRRIMITRHAVADDLACAAHLLMGEGAEGVPVVLVRGAPVDFDGGVYGSADVMMPFEECIFMHALGERLCEGKG